MGIPVPKPIKEAKKKKPKKKPVNKLTKKYIQASERKERRRLEKELKHICSMICRELWKGKCAMCGKEGTAAHHFFGWKACSALRFTIYNLIWLCYGCHIGKVHQQGLTEPARIALITRIGQERFDIMYSVAFGTMEWTVDKLKEVRVVLNEEYIKLVTDGFKQKVS